MSFISYILNFSDFIIFNNFKESEFKKKYKSVLLMFSDKWIKILLTNILRILLKN